MRYLFLFIFYLIINPLSSAYSNEIIERSISLLGYERTQFRVEPLFWQYRSGTIDRLPIFDRWFLEPTKIPFWEKHYREYFQNQDQKFQSLNLLTAPIIGYGTVRMLITPTPFDAYLQLSQSENSLRNALLMLDSMEPHFEPLPEPLEKNLALLIYSIDGFLKKRQLALRHLRDDEIDSLYQLLTLPLEKSVRDSIAPERKEEEEWRIQYQQMESLSKIDFFPFFAGVEDLFTAVDFVIDTLKQYHQNYSEIQWNYQTKYGWITINNGLTPQLIQNNAHLLLHLDFSGDDQYTTGGATGGGKFPVGILLDFDGNDQYTTDNKVPAFGVGVLGVGLLYDQSGNDVYSHSSFYSQGCGLGGVGMLMDKHGNDQFTVLGGGQGFGFYGNGILADMNGNDQYHCFIQAQGCGLPKGVGLLWDKMGDDRYIANDSLIQFPSSQSKDHNTSMAQGAGFGFRRDFLDGRSIAGGVGILVDGSGNDQYYGGVFCQAVGYWYGVGILDDNEGNDHYRGVWYSQSSTAHFGISYLHDGNGDDTYLSVMTMGVGAAHDYSVSVFEDENGNDRYDVQANAVGCALNSSISIFVDKNGNDFYAKGASLGACQNHSTSGLRAEMLTAALFLDLYGKDQYENKKFHNQKRFIYPYQGKPIMKGLFWDLNFRKNH